MGKTYAEALKMTKLENQNVTKIYQTNQYVQQENKNHSNLIGKFL